MSDIKDPKYENLVNHLLYGVYDELDLMRLRKTAAREIRYLSGALNGCELVLNKSTARNDALVNLIKVANCPNCNGDGAYYDSMGEVCQCQWCDEKNKAIRDNTGEQG